MATNFTSASRTILANGDVSYCYTLEGQAEGNLNRICIAKKDGKLYAQSFVSVKWGHRSKDNGGWIAKTLDEVRAYLDQDLSPRAVFNCKSKDELIGAKFY